MTAERLRRSGPRLQALVIGAGVAGLSVARRLHTAGFSVAVLEARPRIGGRLLSVESPQGPLDLGATWFWPNESRVTGLNEELGLATFDQHLEGDALYHVPGGAQRMEGNPIDVSAGRWVLGAQGLAVALWKTLPDDTVLLRHPVSHVRQTSEGVAVDTPAGSFVAEHVVLALPPALAISAIQFSPLLPDHVADLARATPVWMGAVTKVVVRYSVPFWRANGLAGAGISHVGPIREVHDMSGPNGRPAALFGFATATSVDGPTVTPEDVLGQLSEMFGPAAAQPEEVLIRDWRHEAYTSPHDVAHLGVYENFGHRGYATPAFDGRLHWASTETGSVGPGHIEGALAAGERAARAILEHL